MKYTKDQIEELGIRPRERKGMGLLPVEQREVRAVVKAILKDPGELWQFWRLIPFEDGYACQQRKLFEAWVADKVENMWYDIGRPVFEDGDSWSCPDGGWWPYLRTKYLDVSWIEVGNAIIDMDEIWTTLRNYLEEKVQGYRMCPGMMLYRVVKSFLVAHEELRNLTDRGLAETDFSRAAADRAILTLRELEKQMADLVRLRPTETTEKVEDRVWVDPVDPKELWAFRQRCEHKE